MSCKIMRINLFDQLQMVKGQIFFLLSLSFLFGGSAFADSGINNNKAIRISFDKGKLLFSEIIREIERKTDLVFIYDSSILDNEKTLSLSEDQNSIDEIFKVLSDAFGVTFRSIDGNVFVKKNTKPEYFVQGQDRPVSGRVTDSQGYPLPGVSVYVKGTSTGTVTSVDGEYNISVSQGDSILIFSFIGMETQEVSLGGSNYIDVILPESSTWLNEVVAVGYGSTRKVNLTGAVDEVGADVFENRPVNNVTQALQGVVPNLTITLADGKPTRSADFQVRGISSIGQGGSALVLIDGVEGDPTMLNPNDIESVSVLKDAASASIYGSRGTFGIILITTKAPKKDKVSVSYNMNYGIKSPTTVPDFVTNGYTYAKWFSEAYNAFNDYNKIPSSMNKTQKFSLAYLEELKKHDEDPSLPDWELDSNGNYVYYGNTDWYDLLYKDHLTSVDQNISISGSGDKASYYLSGRYNNQEGLFRFNSDDYSIYNFRAKGEIRLTGWLKIENNTEYSLQKYHQPLNVGEGGGVWRNIADEGHPTAPMFNPDGTLTHSAAYTVGDMWYGKNGEDSKRRYVKNTTGLTINMVRDKLKVKGDFTFADNRLDKDRRRVQVPFSRKPDVIEYVGTTTNDLREYNDNTSYLATNVYGEYENTFNHDHYLKVMTGFNYEEQTFESTQVLRNGLLFEDANNISMAIGENKEVEGKYRKWRIAGQFYRVNYSFRDKYLLEFNGRLDASSKFPLDEQTAFFPSFSAGYRISKESFWNVNKNFIFDLKIRASYGSLGNGNVDPYSYIELFTIDKSERVLNGSTPAVTSQPNVIPDGLTWEKATTTNLGLDLGLISGKLNFTGDIYERKTTDMYTEGLPLPAVFGTDVPKGNYADIKTSGWELSVSWRDQLNLASKPFIYNVRFVLADNYSEVTKFNNPNKLLPDGDGDFDYYEGMEIGEIWGFVSEGLFKDEADIQSHADQSYIRVSSNNILLPGDIKFKNLNGDDVIDKGSNRLDDHGDLTIIGNSAPRYTFGLNLGGDWNNFFFSAFFQGVGKQDWWPGAEASHFWGQYNRPYNNLPKWQLGEIWSEDNPYAYLPRYRGYIAGWSRELAQPQSRYIQNVAYIRLKNFQFGYNLPKQLLSRISFVDKVKFYVSGENMWSWSPLYRRTRDFDVENIGGSDTDLTSGGSGNVYNYPVMKTLSFGLSATF
jgi:TonB-linked SusC/RagA family outer membrane protein